MDIKVLGPGCPKCRQTEKVVKEAVAEAGVAPRWKGLRLDEDRRLRCVRQRRRWWWNGEVKSVGKIPSKEDVKSWLKSKEHAPAETYCAGGNGVMISACSGGSNVGAVVLPGGGGTDPGWVRQDVLPGRFRSSTERFLLYGCARHTGESQYPGCYRKPPGFRLPSE